MTTYFELDEISSFSIASEIHQGGGSVRVKNEAEFYFDFKGLTIHALITKGKASYISLVIQDVIVPPNESSSPELSLLSIINEHTQALVPCAVASLLESENKGQYILTIRNDIACDCGMLMEHFQFYVYRFALYTKQLFQKFQKSECIILAQEMLETLKQ